METCLSVVEFPSRKYGSVQLYAAALFVAVPDGDDRLTWMIDRFIGDVYTRRLQAVAGCCRLISAVNGPYLPDVYDDSCVVADVYNTACERLGYGRHIDTFPTPSKLDPEQDQGEI